MWSWAGAASSQYGPSQLQRSEPFQVRESNTYPGTKETSQQGRTTGGNCNLSASPTLLMTPLQKRWGRPVCVHKLFTLRFIGIFEDMFAKLMGNDLMLFGTELIQETAKWCSGQMPVVYRLETISPESCQAGALEAVMVVTAAGAFIVILFVVYPRQLSD